MQRGEYDQIIIDSLEADLKTKVTTLVKKVIEGKKIDEHGGWDFGIESLDRKGRTWVSLNWDLYGVGNDVHSGNLLAVIQVRQSVKPRKSRDWVQTKKSYFLLGTNEDETSFAHPVDFRSVRDAIRKDKDVILAVQNWIFQGDYIRMVRQGDMALLPLLVKPNLKNATEIMSESLVLSSNDNDTGTHRLTADRVYQNNNLYALNPRLVHEPGTHPYVSAQGWCKIIVGQRGRFWNFAKPTID